MTLDAGEGEQGYFDRHRPESAFGTPRAPARESPCLTLSHGGVRPAPWLKIEQQTNRQKPFGFFSTCMYKEFT